MLSAVARAPIAALAGLVIGAAPGGPLAAAPGRAAVAVDAAQARLAAAGAPAAGPSRADGQPAAPQAQGGAESEAAEVKPDPIALADHLRRIGAVFFGAWWCPHCTHQKTLFGPEASERLPYVECDKEEAGRRRCAAAAIRAFPTWDLNGERLEGTLSLVELARWSRFQPLSSPAR